jgi:hypothetical protein
MILASVITYELSKRIGRAKAAEMVQRHAAQLVAAGETVLPAIRVVQELRKHQEVAFLHDAGGTSIGHARSRAFSVALQGDVDLWVSIDDDTECSPDTVTHLLSSLDPETPQIVIVPCLLRQETQCANVTMDPSSKLDRITKTGAHLRRALYGGFGIVAVTKAALRELRDLYDPTLGYTDDDGARRVGIFCEFIRDGWWFRDDYAFFDRVPPHVRVEALCSGDTNHAGYKLCLELLENVPQIPRPPAMRPTARKPYAAPTVRDASPAEYAELVAAANGDGRSD